jgi:hypothetical protein
MWKIIRVRHAGTESDEIVIMNAEDATPRRLRNLRHALRSRPLSCVPIDAAIVFLDDDLIEAAPYYSQAKVYGPIKDVIEIIAAHFGGAHHSLSFLDFRLPGWRALLSRSCCCRLVRADMRVTADVWIDDLSFVVCLQNNAGHSIFKISPDFRVLEDVLRHADDLVRPGFRPSEEEFVAHGIGDSTPAIVSRLQDVPRDLLAVSAGR